MSNLNLPNLSFESLVAKKGTIAYATTTFYNYADETVHIAHHGNPIARLQRGRVFIDTCGWDSKTTAQRLDRVLRDNGIALRVVIRQGITCLVQHDDLRKIVAEIGTAHFALDDSGNWNLLDVATEAQVSA